MTVANVPVAEDKILGTSCLMIITTINYVPYSGLFSLGENFPEW